MPGTMIEDIRDTNAETLTRFDAIIDVRSPSEFAADHLPGAINLPVLDDVERAEVGTIYKQESRFRARRIGAAFVARNIARHLDGKLATREKLFNPLIYCWRGGMRSNAMATVLTQVGWRVGLLNGGYKTWRRAVVAALRDSTQKLPLVLLDGQTGTAKSDILRAFGEQGGQILDLEALANHRGSVFGGFADAPQPSQTLFESKLWAALQALDHTKPILVEAESNRIARCEIPKRIWTAMRAAPHITVSSPPTVRAAYLQTAYADIIADKTSILDAVNRLRPFHPKEKIEAWCALAQSGTNGPLAAELMLMHYDPLYNRSRRRRATPPLAHFALEKLDAATFATVARKIAFALSNLGPKESIDVSS